MEVGVEEMAVVTWTHDEAVRWESFVSWRTPSVFKFREKRNGARPSSRCPSARPDAANGILNLAFDLVCMPTIS